MFKILKPFPYSPDGLTVVPLTPDSEDQPIRDDVSEGLVAGGFIEPVKAKSSRQAAA